MSMGPALRYHLNVTLLGRGFLRWQRLRMASRLKKTRSHQHLAPPLATWPRLKEILSLHYLKGRYVSGHRKVAWVSSGAPVEPLVALGFYLLYPENHGALCAIRRMSEELMTVAEDAGYSRDLCSYVRTDLGSVLSGRSPAGNLPRPDLLLCCTNICQTVLHWYRVLAHHFDVPLILVDTPFLYRGATPHALAFVQRQMEDYVSEAERVAGRRLSWARLRRVLTLSRDAVELWARILAQGRQRPSPLTAFDAFVHMGPIVEMRGQEICVDYYQQLLAELRQRVENGVGALEQERFRLLWDNLPVWHRLRWFSELLAARGAALVASTYANAWGELASLIDPQRPMESAARVYLHPILNVGVGDKLRKMQGMVEEYSLDGAILHSDRSCKPYSIGQVDQRNALVRGLQVPSLLLEADHNDPRSFSPEQASGRLDAFLEMLESHS